MTQLNNEVKMQMKGKFGERIASHVLSELGYNVTDSLSQWDSEKDLTLDGKWKCEVKTQEAFHTENAFSIMANQLKKCKNVDLLLVVETFNNKDQIKVWGNKDPDTRKFYTKHTRDGRTMKLIKKDCFKLMKHIIDPDIIEEMRGFSVSEW